MYVSLIGTAGCVWYRAALTVLAALSLLSIPPPRPPNRQPHPWLSWTGGRRQDTSDAARALFKKNQGNASFKENDFQQAAVFYTESLLLGLSLARAFCPFLSFAARPSSPP